jgi:glycosyltransferase involved in cell wall biosynthesis
MLAECGEGAREKLVVIHCGVDTEFFRPRGAMVYDGRLEILSVGTLHEVKGQRFLVEACRLLRDEGVDVSCKLVGDGPDRKALTRQIAAAGLEDRVVLLGRHDRDGVCELLRSAHVLVAPSVPTKQGKREGIPIVLMEAMASGVPVVASRISGIPELVEDGVSGLLVPPADARSLASALAGLQADPSMRERLALSGRAKVEAEFDLRKSAAELVSRFARARVAA